MPPIGKINMPIVINKTDILSVKEGIIIHGCNMQGKFNSGLAKSIREMYPDVYDAYMNAFNKRQLLLGKVIYHQVNDGLLFANAVTQVNYGRDENVVYVNYQAIKSVFKDVALVATKNNMVVHFPMIGCGLANGDWNIIKEIIRGELKHVQRAVYHEYRGIEEC